MRSRSKMTRTSVFSVAGVPLSGSRCWKFVAGSAFCQIDSSGAPSTTIDSPSARRYARISGRPDCGSRDRRRHKTNDDEKDNRAVTQATYHTFMATLTFLGAARTVTGSKHLLEVDGHRILFDCGLFQGLKELRLRNWSPLPVPPETIDAVVLTHAHIDHCGLAAAPGRRRDSRDRCIAPAARADLCQLVLPDAAHLQEEDAKFANKRGFSKHQPALPLYTEEDAAEALSRFRTVAVRQEDRSRQRHRGRVHQRRPPAGLVVRAASRAPTRAAAASCSAATLAAIRGRSFRIRRRASTRTCCSSNRPTAIAFIPPMTTARRWRESSRRRSRGAAS